MPEQSEEQIIAHVAQRLADAHAEVEPARISSIVNEQYARFDGRPIRDFVPLFVERGATSELSKLSL